MARVMAISTQIALLLLLSATASANGEDWKFLSSYPQHYLAHRLRPSDEVVVDGNLSDPCWRDLAEWHEAGFVDITHHSEASLNAVPSYQQASVAVLWDSDYLYVAARLKEPFVWGLVPNGHNGATVPYKDNDFEVFIDPSGTTQ